MNRAADDLFDPRIADWLEADPTRAPRELLEDVLRTVPAIDQRRDPTFRRAVARRAAWPLATAAAVVIAVIATSIFVSRADNRVAGPSNPPGPSGASPTAQVSAPPSAPRPPSAAPDLTIVPTLTKRFTSPTYGYSIALRPAWTTAPATLPWAGPDNSDPVVDDITLTGTDTTITGASQALAPGQTFDDWLIPFAANTGGLAPSCTGGDPATWPAVQVGDAVGRWQQMCNAAEVVVESGGRAYVFTWGNSTFDPSRRLSVDDYKAVLTTVRFDPGSVPPSPSAPPLTKTFISPRHGYSVQLPADWTTKAASESWEPGTPLDYGNPALDTLQSKTQRLVVTSQPLLPGQTPDEWIALYCQMYQPSWVNCDTAIPTWPQVAVGDTTGLIDGDGSSTVESVVDNGRLFDAVVVKDGRGYGISFDGLVDRATFEALLASMTLDPASAVDASPSPT